MNNRIIKRNPFSEFEEIERQLMGDFFAPTWKNNWRKLSRTPSRLSEDDKNYYLQVELPGVGRNNIKIDAGDKFVHIHGERKEEDAESAEQHYSEFTTYGSFNREYHFNSPINKDRVEGNYRSGILKLIIPKKADQSEVKQVKIQQVEE